MKKQTLVRLIKLSTARERKIGHRENKSSDVKVSMINKQCKHWLH